MHVHVENYNLQIGDIRITGISSSSVFLIGDTEVIACASRFDTPPESLLVTPFVVPAAPAAPASRDAAEGSGAADIPASPAAPVARDGRRKTLRAGNKRA